VASSASCNNLAKVGFRIINFFFALMLEIWSWFTSFKYQMLTPSLILDTWMDPPSTLVIWMVLCTLNEFVKSINSNIKLNILNSNYTIWQWWVQLHNYNGENGHLYITTINKPYAIFIFFVAKDNNYKHVLVIMDDVMEPFANRITLKLAMWSNRH